MTLRHLEKPIHRGGVSTAAEKLGALPRAHRRRAGDLLQERMGLVEQASQQDPAGHDGLDPCEDASSVRRASASVSTSRRPIVSRVS